MMRRVHRSTRVAATCLAVAAALTGCSQVKSDLGIKDAPSPTSAPLVYQADLLATCNAVKVTIDTDGDRLSTAVGASSQADAIARIAQDYRDLQREVTRVPAPTKATSGTALEVVNRLLPSITGLDAQAVKVRNMTAVLSPTDITDITGGTKSDFCTTYLAEVTKLVPAS